MHGCERQLAAAKKVVLQGFAEASATDDFVRLPASALEELLGEDALDVDIEELVYNALRRWHMAQQPPPDHETTARLLRLVRWARLSKDFLREHVNSDPIVTPHLIVLTEAFQEAAFGGMPPKRLGACHCTFSAPFDTNGALYFIATSSPTASPTSSQGGRRPYVNPHDAGEVVSSASSESGEYDAKAFVQHVHADPLSNYTNNQPSSWMAVDLGEDRSLVANYYCLRTDEAQGFKLRSWELQGSNDGADWTVLRSHEDDTSLPTQPMSLFAWPVEAAGRAFRHFRILQTGEDSERELHLTCAGIELYGYLMGGSCSVS